MADQKYLKITGNCATEAQTYFGGEVVMVPQDVPAQLAAEWTKAGLAEETDVPPPEPLPEIEPEPEPEPDPKADLSKPQVRAHRTRKQGK